MAQLSDSIEKFIKDMMSGGTYLEVRRNELAQHFGCAPSQINYVLATRFSVNHGYIIESRRGGGGYVRIVRMQPADDEDLVGRIIGKIGNSVDEESACALIAYLLDQHYVTRREALLMRSAVTKNALALPVSAKDILRASVLKNMILQVFENYEEDKRNDV